MRKLEKVILIDSEGKRDEIVPDSSEGRGAFVASFNKEKATVAASLSTAQLVALVKIVCAEIAKGFDETMHNEEPTTPEDVLIMLASMQMDGNIPCKIERTN